MTKSNLPVTTTWPWLAEPRRKKPRSPRAYANHTPDSRMTCEPSLSSCPPKRRSCERLQEAKQMPRTKDESRRLLSTDSQPPRHDPSPPARCSRTESRKSFPHACTPSKAASREGTLKDP